MYKKLFLCLLLTTDLYPAEQGKNDELSTVAMTAVIVTAGALVFAMYASDEKKFEELTSKLSEGDIAKIFEVAGAWLILTEIIQSLLYVPTTYKEVCKDWFPTEEQIAIDEAEVVKAHDKLKYLKAEESFFDCMIASNKSGAEKNSLGCPVECEELAQKFTSLGGQSEVDRITKAFNKYEK